MVIDTIIHVKKKTNFWNHLSVRVYKLAIHHRYISIRKKKIKISLNAAVTIHMLSVDTITTSLISTKSKGVIGKNDN